MASYRVPVLEDFAWQPPVNDRVTAPTEAETQGTRYLIIVTATGIFTGHEGKIATAKQNNPTLIGHWYLDVPDEGWTTYVLDENAWYVYDGVIWNKESVDALQSQVLILESETSALQGHQASATSALSVVSAKIATIESSEASQASVQSAIASRVLVLESEVSALQGHQASATSALSALSAAIVGFGTSEASQASVQSAIASRVLVLESEMSQAESGLLTKQSEASYIAAYGCLMFIV